MLGLTTRRGSYPDVKKGINPVMEKINTISVMVSGDPFRAASGTETVKKGHHRGLPAVLSLAKKIENEYYHRVYHQ